MNVNTDRKKLVLISHVMPDPIMSGGSKCINTKIKWLANYFDIYFIYNGENAFELEKYNHFLDCYCEDYFYATNKIANSRKFIKSIFNLISGKPLIINRFIQNYEHIYSIIKRINPDIINFEHLYSLFEVDLERIKTLTSAKLYLIEHNLEYSLRMKLIHNKGNNIIIKFIAKLEFCLLLKYIRNIYRVFDKIGYLSKSDLTRAVKEVDFDKLYYTPPIETLNINLKSFLAKYQNKSYNNLLFPFNPLYRPNVEALEDFLQHSFERIIRINFEVKLTISGDYEKFPATVLGLIDRYSANIVVTGYLNEEEYSRVLACSDVLINPVLIGSGIKIKNLEALREGVVVLTTPVGAEGIHSSLLISCDDLASGYSQITSMNFNSQDYQINEAFFTELIQANLEFYEITQ